MKNVTRRVVLWGAITVLILLLPLLMQFTNEVQWNEAIAYGVILSGVGIAYELWRWLRTKNTIYRFAFFTGLFGALLIGWVNGAVGIIGNEDNPANLMYGAIFVVGLIGSIISRFRPIGMARTLFAAALVQISVPIIALFVWPAQTSWGNAGVVGVFIFNFIFVVFFLTSAVLFKRAAQIPDSL